MNKFKNEYLLEQANKLKNKKYEIAVLAPLLFDRDLLCVQPYTQYPVNGYFIDIFYPNLQLAIEIDEIHHEKQIETDDSRQNIIVECMNCSFERIKDFSDIFEVISKIKGIIIDKIDTQKIDGTFKEWDPTFFDLQTAQRDWPNAIFYKTTKETNPGELSPLRGPFKISDENRKNANLLVGISGNTVTAVYESSPDSWQLSDNAQLGYYNTGKEIADHSLISSGTTDTWIRSSNKVFGDNLQKG